MTYATMSLVVKREGEPFILKKKIGEGKQTIGVKGPKGGYRGLFSVKSLSWFHETQIRKARKKLTYRVIKGHRLSGLLVVSSF